jgi:hypothetical protein
MLRREDGGRYQTSPKDTWLAVREDESTSSNAATTMKQRSFASLSFDAKLLALIEPRYPTEGRPSRQPIPHATSPT